MRKIDDKPARAGADKRVSMGHVAAILSACSSCGQCNATCPTFEVTRDERDGPRGRIHMMRLAAETEADRATLQTVSRHLDRCLGCGVCDAVCPEDVAFGEALGDMRANLAERIGDGVADRERAALVADLTGIEPARGVAAWAGRASKPLAGWIGKLAARRGKDQDGSEPVMGGGNTGGLLGEPGTAFTQTERRGRLLLVPGCGQRALRPQIGDAAIKLLARRGFDVTVPADTGCCGGVFDQIGANSEAAAMISGNVVAWSKAQARLAAAGVGVGGDGERDGAAVSVDPAGGAAEFDALITIGRTCGAMLQAYPTRLGAVAVGDGMRNLIASASDVLTFLGRTDFGVPQRWSSLRIGYLVGCQGRMGRPAVGQSSETVDKAGMRLLREFGFTVRPVSDPTLCCGGGGVYPWVAPELAGRLRRAKTDPIRTSEIDAIAVSDPGCAGVLQDRLGVAVVHAVELLNWAHGGEPPAGLAALAPAMTDVPTPVVEDEPSA